MTKKLRKATELAHLIETHPDLEYRGDLYADSLVMKYSRGHSNYLDEKENIEQELNELAKELETDRVSAYPKNDLDKDIEEMVSQVKKLNEVTYLDKKLENTRIWKNEILEQLEQRSQEKLAELKNYTYIFGR